MKWSDLLSVRLQAALARGAARDIDNTQERISESKYPDVICHALNKGKLKFQPKKKKLSEAVHDSIM